MTSITSPRRAARARRSLLVALLLASTLMPAALHAQTLTFDIPGGSLAQALASYARQSGRQLLYPSALVANRKTPALSGQLSPDDALARLLAGTGLRVDAARPGVFVLTAGSVADAGGGTDASATQAAGAPTTDEASARPFGPAATQTLPPEVAPVGQAATELAEIVVTGTNIRGTDIAGSPVIRLDRADIDRSGALSATQLLQQLPQANGAGPNEGTATVPTTSNLGNVSYPSSINLRGLGPSSTLVLINGRRPAGSGISGDYVDTSLVPLAAIERVEILTDGASALYGADAVAGVVNFILRRDYEGAESRLTLGSVTDGGLRDVQLAQTLGTRWSSGSLLLAYEYGHRNSLAYSDRSFTASSDLRARGGDNFDTYQSVPGNIIVGGVSYAIPHGQDGRTLTAADLQAGTRNDQTLYAGADLLPAVDRHSGFASLRQDLTGTIRLEVEGRYSRRHSVAALTPPNGLFQVPASNAFYVHPLDAGTPVQVAYSFAGDGVRHQVDATVEAWGLAGDLVADIAHDWQLRLSSQVARESSVSNSTGEVHRPSLTAALADGDPDTALNLFGDGADNNPATLAAVLGGFQRYDLRSTLESLGVMADGPLLTLPGGDLKLAIGGDLRWQHLDVEETNGRTTVDPVTRALTDEGRRVSSVYGELYVPLVGAANQRRFVHRLSASLAGRLEHDSRYGSAFSPKLGVSWWLDPTLSFHASLGRSVRAPSLQQLETGANSIYLLPLPDPSSPSGTSLVLGRIGNSDHLDKEQARTWTLGLTWEPTVLAGTRFDLRYFNISFRNRIGLPASLLTIPLLDPEAYASIIARTPSVDDVWALVSSPAYKGSPITREALESGDVTIDAILDFRQQNLARTQVRGLDATARHQRALAGGSLVASLNASVLFDFKRALVEGLPLVEVVDTITNPVDLRLTGQLGWQRGGWSSTLTWRYTDSYRDTLSTPARTVAAWNTFDLQLAYETSASAPAWLRDTRLALNIQNLFDTDPPFVNNAAGVAFDPENAAALGRFVSLQLTRRW